MKVEQLRSAHRLLFDGLAIISLHQTKPDLNKKF